MAAGQRSAQAMFSHRSTILTRDAVCVSCLSRLALQSRRHVATAAVASSESPSPSRQELEVPPVTQLAPRKAYRLLSSPVISRPPLLTRDLTSFEKAFYLYQKRLNERLSLPFTRYFYYKKGTPGDREWKRKLRLRKSAATDIGDYSGYGAESWNDEVLVGDSVAEPASIVEGLLKDAQGKEVSGQEQLEETDAAKEESSDQIAEEEEDESRPASQEVIIEKPQSRVTEADLQNDLRSLNRKLDRTLYLLIQNKEGRWRFPEDRVYGKENIHQAAERVLVQSLGVNMNTWVIGNHPVGHYSFDFPAPINAVVPPNPLVHGSTSVVEQEEFGEKVFFMRARIMAGKPDLSKNEFGDKDFRWLAKEEIPPVVTPKYWSCVKNMLAER